MVFLRRLINIIKSGRTRLSGAGNRKRERIKDFPGLSRKWYKDSSIVLGCLSWFYINGETRIVWRGQHIFTSGTRTSVEQGRIFEIVRQIGDDGMDFMLSRKYKFRFHGTNTDIIDDAGNMICRGNADELREFMRYHRQTQAQKQEWLVSARIDKESSKFVYNPDETAKLLGERIPPSAPPHGGGLSPDFRNARDYLYKGDLQFGKVELRMSGSREVDFRMLNERFGFPDTPETFVWHHLDEVWLNDAGELTCTMQLIRREAHEKIVVASQKGTIQSLSEVLVAGEHVGSVAIWRSFYKGVTYK